MRATEMLDHQADLILRMTNHDIRKVWIRQLAEDSLEKMRVDAMTDSMMNVPESEEALLTRQAVSNGAASMNILMSALREASAFHVVPDLTQLVIFAASQLNDTDRFDYSLAPTRSGFVRFEGGLPFNDVRGSKLTISWLAWGPAVVNMKSNRHDVGEPTEAMAIWMWNDHRSEPDDIAQKMAEEYGKDTEDSYRRIFGRWGFIGNGMLIDGMKLGPAWLNPTKHLPVPIEAVYSDYIPQEFTNVNRMVHAFFLLLGQTVTATRSAIPDRPTRRRAARAGLPQRVTVVSLRNLEVERKPGESLVEWSHRWPVRGFWRWQVCGPNHPIAQEISPGKWRARIWIAPHVKGPADKPLIISDKVYSIHR